MTARVRAPTVIVTLFLLVSGYTMVNLRYMARTIGYDEVYYFRWVDNWEQYEVHYPHHLLFTASSVWFQRHFSELTGITSTAFIQKTKNILVVAAGLGLFFALFYRCSGRYWLSLLVALLIGFSGSVWHNATLHETAAVPGILVNVAAALLLFYRRSAHPLLLLVVVAVTCSLAILLHQVYLLAVPALFAGLLACKPVKDRSFSFLRNLARSGVFLLVVVGLVGGAYYYIGFVRLGLRLQDNPEGAQSVRYFESIPIRGNFVRYFYLIQARGVWGQIRERSLEHALDGFGSSFITTYRNDRVAPDGLFTVGVTGANAVFAVVGAVLIALVALAWPAVRTYGALYPALLAWLVAGSLFVYWWEPHYIEHWLYITILVWVLAFAVLNATLDRLRPAFSRQAAYLGVCFAFVSFLTVAVRENHHTTIVPSTEKRIPAAVHRHLWDDAYHMNELFDPPGSEGRRP